MKNINNNLIIKKISLDYNNIPNKKIYPFNLDIVKKFKELKIESPVTLFIGENGSGKSTFIEAIAEALNLPTEGGTQNFNYESKTAKSLLSNYLTISKFNIAKTTFFLRAESFFNFAIEVDKLNINHYYGGNLHECSHGESFINLVKNRFTENGLYILDEPEAALSPQRQLTLLYLIDDLVKNGSQFIIATHSPILIGYKNGIIYDLDNNFKKTNYKDTEIYSIYKMFIDNPELMQERLFDNK